MNFLSVEVKTCIPVQYCFCISSDHRIQNVVALYNCVDVLKLVHGVNETHERFV
jgi:hypothetical protein